MGHPGPQGPQPVSSSIWALSPGTHSKLQSLFEHALPRLTCTPGHSLCISAWDGTSTSPPSSHSSSQLCTQSQVCTITGRAARHPAAWSRPGYLCRRWRAISSHKLQEALGSDMSGASQFVPPPSKPGDSLQLPCSFAGGLATVIYTDALQTVIMVVGAVILAIKGEDWSFRPQWGGAVPAPVGLMRSSHEAVLPYCPLADGHCLPASCLPSLLSCHQLRS